MTFWENFNKVMFLNCVCVRMLLFSINAEAKLTLGKNTQLFPHVSSISTLVYLDMHMCTLLSNNLPVFPASLWLPCRSAARRLGASDPTTWPTSAAPAAATTPAPPRMKRRRRSSRGSLSKAEVERRGRRKFPTTLGTAKTRTWQSAQVKPPRSAGRLLLLLTCCVVYLHRSNDILIFCVFTLPCVFVFTQHPIETPVPLTKKKWCLHC